MPAGPGGEGIYDFRSSVCVESVCRIHAASSHRRLEMANPGRKRRTAGWTRGSKFLLL